MSGTAPDANIFALRNPFGDPLRRTVFALAAGVVERLFALRRCSMIYRELPPDVDSTGFPAWVLNMLDITCTVTSREAGQIPASGPAIVVANHPFGAVEGVILADMLRKIRPDVKIMANFLLDRIPELRDLFITVDPFGGGGAAHRNTGPLRECIRWVRQGGMLVIFPAGEVSHLSLMRREIADPPWSPTLARIVGNCRAPVLPVYFSGRNSLLFQLLGLVHPRLRTAMLPRELLNKGGAKIRVRVGAPIPFRKLESFGSERELTGYLRMRTYLLENEERQAKERGNHGHRNAPVAPPEEPALLLEEIGRLPEGQLLAESGPHAVFHAEAGQIPGLLREIGRLRELTFRMVGEGTGSPADLDRFDGHYRHLFIWNRDTCEVVGAYRLGETDTILERHGMDGLYTGTLFTYRADFLERIGPALEVGRSFVRPEYQKSYLPLLLLWKGIGRFIAGHSRYRVLFGAVSISREYSDLSRQIIAGSLQQSRLIPELARLVKGRTPFHLRPLKVRGCEPATGWQAALDLDDIAAMVADIEPEQKGVPVLLRHYLDLGGKLLSFNIDRGFSDVLDGLIVVDLLATEPKTLERYMGTEGAKTFRARHLRERETTERRSA
ncbi:MAG TPA: GNAT family N-acyltransferase [Candidatus Methylomirabilis sp.]|nr:GNAT family N-acyltransferase [Candidatus Methylomirabilis sp.]